MKKQYFISGLPRSGSTLLSNILAQNPRFFSTETSGIADIMFGVRNNWDTLIEFKAAPNEEGKKRVLRGILDSYFSDKKEPVIFDKSRAWVSLIEMLEGIGLDDIKIIVPVRDVRDILSSFEKLHRKNGLSQSSLESNNYIQSQTTEGRANVLLNPSETLGLALNRIHDALQRGHSDKMIFVDFDDLTNDPERCMRQIYSFLGEEYFDHDFDNVEQVTFEDDSVHGIQGLHDIRQKVLPVPSDWEKILGSWAEELKKFNFWKI